VEEGRKSIRGTKKLVRVVVSLSRIAGESSKGEREIGHRCESSVSSRRRRNLKKESANANIIRTGGGETAKVPQDRSVPEKTARDACSNVLKSRQPKLYTSTLKKRRIAQIESREDKRGGLLLPTNWKSYRQPPRKERVYKRRKKGVNCYCEKEEVRQLTVWEGGLSRKVSRGKTNKRGDQENCNGGFGMVEGAKGSYD